MSQRTRPAPKVVIIVLNWNQKNLTLACLDSVMKADYPDYEVILIDNVSTDGSCEAVEKQFPAVTLIKSKKQLGLTDSRNIGIDYALRRSADYVMVLDNDTIIHKDMLAELVEVAERDDRVAVVAPKIYSFSEPKKLWALGGTVNFCKGEIRLLGYGELDRGQYDSPSAISVDYAIGCCSMIRAQVIHRIGKLDPGFYYGEDTEFCLRARRFGYKIKAVTQAVMWHKDSRTWAKEDDVKYIRVKAVMGVMRRYAGIHHWIIFSFYALIGLSVLTLREGLEGDVKAVYWRIKGAFDSLIKR